MLLVVYYHVILITFGLTNHSGWSLNDIFVTFRMPLFFFLSGFLMYKMNQFKSKDLLRTFLRKKGMVQLLPTLIFSLIFALITATSYRMLLFDRFKCGYWFTYTLFFYFVIYSVGDFMIGKWVNGRQKVAIGALIAAMIYSVSKYSVFPTCPWLNSPISNFIGLANFQYFLFFFVGALVRAYFGKVEQWLEQDRFVTGVIVGFVVLLFILYHPYSRDWFITNNLHPLYSLIQSFTGFFGIAVVFVFFRVNEDKILNSGIGNFLQYIGIRTLDVYLLQRILILTNMRFIGQFLSQHNSAILELLFGSVISLVIIVLCLLISRILRCSDTLAKLLFGKVIKDDQGI